MSEGRCADWSVGPRPTSSLLCSSHLCLYTFQRIPVSRKLAKPQHSGGAARTPKRRGARRQYLPFRERFLDVLRKTKKALNAVMSHSSSLLSRIRSKLTGRDGASLKRVCSCEHDDQISLMIFVRCFVLEGLIPVSRRLRGPEFSRNMDRLPWLEAAVPLLLDVSPGRLVRAPAACLEDQPQWGFASQEPVLSRTTSCSHGNRASLLRNHC